MASDLNRSIARLTAPGGYCSGALIAPDIVLTCAHFLARRGCAGVRVRIDGSAELTMTELAGAWAATMPSHFAAATAPNAAV